ncbi:hypothetical protein [Lacinutrix sp.]|uniref:hypothetical protein n=1 Tax=Lacinutrix sp. TaxID=1937692 RepID=UPI0025C1D7A8|nr:hypothetical protein [Lacinutrix sp.]
MTALYIIGIILGVILFFGLGYYLWKISMDKYDYNIFNFGVIIRGLLAIGFLYFSGFMIEVEVESSILFLCVSLALWLWTFIETTIKTNIFIAFFSLIYQLFAVFLIKMALNKILK